MENNKINTQKSLPSTSINWEITAYDKLPKNLILSGNVFNYYLHILI